MLSQILTRLDTFPLSVNKPFAVAAGGLLSRAVVGVGPLTGIVRHHSDDVEQTGEQLQAEVEHTDPKT